MFVVPPCYRMRGIAAKPATGLLLFLRRKKICRNLQRCWHSASLKLRFPDRKGLGENSFWSAPSTLPKLRGRILCGVDQFNRSTMLRIPPIRSAQPAMAYRNYRKEPQICSGQATDLQQGTSGGEKLTSRRPNKQHCDTNGFQGATHSPRSRLHS